jgi:hypothetical protein
MPTSIASRRDRFQSGFGVGMHLPITIGQWFYSLSLSVPSQDRRFSARESPRSPCRDRLRWNAAIVFGGSRRLVSNGHPRGNLGGAASGNAVTFRCAASASSPIAIHQRGMLDFDEIPIPRETRRQCFPLPLESRHSAYQPLCLPTTLHCNPFALSNSPFTVREFMPCEPELFF